MHTDHDAYRPAHTDEEEVRSLMARSPIYHLAAVLSLPLILFCGCTQEETVGSHSQEGPARYKKVQADLSLECGRVHKNYVSGKKGQKMTFVLKNHGLTPVSIDEWYMADQENVRLFYARCEKGKASEVKESDWKRGWPLKEKEPGRHMPVCLNPNQGILLDVPMEFLRTFTQKKTVDHVAVRVELALKSVSLQSPVYEVEVRPIVYQY